MANPFDVEDGIFLALANDEGQHSLWPAAQPVPAGWRVASGPDTRGNCLRFVEENWTDMRPTSLVAHAAAAGGAA
ncbi:MbtH family NRPS accessory protein [Streptomyces sioyaensis]|uniref:MbtH family protein n=1 Tax=Streptomyces sioyaensis TaxID=67364 RepID=UPI0036E3DD79